MKITNLQCPSCGGKLEPMKDNPKIVVCEYCKSQYVLEEDQTINYHIHQYATPQANADTGSSGGSFSLGTGAVAGLMCAFLAVAIGAGIFVGNAPKGSSQPRPSRSAAVSADREKEADGSRQPESAVSAASPLYEAMITEMFHKSQADQVTEEDLARVRYISVNPGSESVIVEYSFEDPYGDSRFQPETLILEPQVWDEDNLSFFTGLKKLDMSHTRNIGSLRELTGLKGLVCSGVEIQKAAELVADPGQLMELSLKDVESLEGIGAFEILQSLVIDGITSPDLKQLVPLKQLKTLTVIEDDDSDPFRQSDSSRSLTDYSALSVLTGLEGLTVESAAIRDLSFLKPLVNLSHLSLSETEAISLEPLGSLTGLTSLALADNASVLDYAPVGNLTGLTSLVIDKGTSQEDPDLSSLTGLEKLDMSGFISVSFLRNMGFLKELSLHGCNIDEISALSGLSGLERLTCYSVWTYAVPLKNVDFIDHMPNLTFLDFCGISQGDVWGGYQRNTEILGDISNVLNHPGLEELYLNNCMFEIDFGKLKENPSLRKLELREIKLKENFYVQSSNGMTDLWYDDVTLDEHTDFLANYPNLEELYLDGNQLTQIQFTASLKHLTHLGINNNYVTELSPLNQAESLQYLDIRQNPITSTIETDGKVQILK